MGALTFKYQAEYCAKQGSSKCCFWECFIGADKKIRTSDLRISMLCVNVL